VTGNFAHLREKWPQIHADCARAAEESHGLGLFVRSLVGLDRAAATEAFSAFLADTTYTPAQIDFVLTIDEVRAHAVAG
jgi:type I restriction enzyme, R subunit